MSFVDPAPSADPSDFAAEDSAQESKGFECGREAALFSEGEALNKSPVFGGNPTDQADSIPGPSAVASLPARAPSRGAVIPEAAHVFE